jgi:hypothetical protein
MTAAMDYVNRGLFVLPLHSVHSDGTCRCRKAHSCSSPGKHPLGALAPHGWKDASCYGPTVRRWFTTRPMANLGVVLGPSRLAVIDVDPRNGGNDSIEKLIGQHGPLPPTLHLLTGGGGDHYIYADPHREVRSHKPMPGIDILAGAALIVVPPSRHRSGELYRWPKWPTDPMPFPAWMSPAVAS